MSRLSAAGTCLKRGNIGPDEVCVPLVSGPQLKTHVANIATARAAVHLECLSSITSAQRLEASHCGIERPQR